MSVARKIFAITFVVFIGITLMVPSFPPAQLLYKYVSIVQTTLSIWGISIATLLSGIINGFLWTIIVIAAYGFARLALHIRKPRSLPPMPVAPQLTTPPPENPIVDSRVNIIPPALTIPSTPSFTVRKKLTQTVIRREPVPIKVSKEPIGVELDVETIMGIGSARGALLRNSGIVTVSDLLRAGATKRGRDNLANEVGVDSATVLRWVYRGDLLRIRGIGKKYSALLESAGVNTVTKLSTKNPRNLWQTLRAVNRERNLVRRSPNSKTLEIWVRNAKNLEPILVE